MLEKMEIYALTLNGDKDSNNKFTLQVNPLTISVKYKIEHTRNDTLNSIGNDCKFNRMAPGSLSFKVVFDDTGVINTTSPGVTAQIKSLLDLCYLYQGDKHEPNKLAIVWGEMIFKSTLESVDIEYKLFSPEGKPLRAELKMNFSEYISKDEEPKKKNDQSPDITHVFQIQAGSSLPSICKNVYRNTKMYLEIARINKLTDFRYIKPGTRIFLPPLK